MNSVKLPCSPWGLVAQWIKHPSSVEEVMGSMTQIFSLSHTCVMLISSLSTFCYQAERKSPSLFTYQYKLHWAWRRSLLDQDAYFFVPNFSKSTVSFYTYQSFSLSSAGYPEEIYLERTQHLTLEATILELLLAGRLCFVCDVIPSDLKLVERSKMCKLTWHLYKISKRLTSSLFSCYNFWVM